MYDLHSMPSSLSEVYALTALIPLTLLYIKHMTILKMLGIKKVSCAGCSIQDELFSSFEQLLSIADRKSITYDRCVPATHHKL